MNLLKTFQEKYTKKSLPELKSGDVVRVHEKIREGKKERIQIFEGIIIAIHDGKSLDASFTARKISFGVGVEKIFPLHLPTIIKIEKVKKVRSRRSKLYYLRNLTDKQLKRRSELTNYGVWKDAKAQAEEDELKAKKEAEAKIKADAKKKEQEELDKKFAEAKAQEQPVKDEKVEKKDKEENKKETKEDKKTK